MNLQNFSIRASRALLLLPLMAGMQVQSGEIGGEDISPGACTFTLTFSESVTGRTAAEVTGTHDTKGARSGSGATYSLPVTPLAQGARPPAPPLRSPTKSKFLSENQS